jgi:hypothetical protein
MEKKKPYFLGYAPKKSNIQKLAQYIENKDKDKNTKVQKNNKQNNKRF